MTPGCRGQLQGSGLFLLPGWAGFNSLCLTIDPVDLQILSVVVPPSPLPAPSLPLHLPPPCCPRSPPSSRQLSLLL